MSIMVREELHGLVDSLREEELQAAQRYLVYLRNFGSDPFAGLSDTERDHLHAVLRESRAQHEQGLGIPASEALKRLRSEE